MEGEAAEEENKTSERRTSHLLTDHRNVLAFFKNTSSSTKLVTLPARVNKFKSLLLWMKAGKLKNAEKTGGMKSASLKLPHRGLTVNKRSTPVQVTRSWFLKDIQENQVSTAGGPGSKVISQGHD